MPRVGDNIYRRKDGRWEGRFAKARVEGRIKYGYVFAHSREDAKLKMEASVAALQLDKASERTPSESDCLFHEVSAKWIDFLKPQLKQQSINKYTNIINSYLEPELGQLKMCEISRASVMHVINALLLRGGKQGSGLAPKTVTDIYSVIKNIFDYGAREMDLQLADIEGIHIKQAQKQLRILSRAEQRKLTLYLKENLSLYHLGILISLYTGIRIGEICALKWQDISFSEQKLYVSRTMQRVQKLDSNSKKTEIIIASPKSECSIRQIPIPNELFNLLLAERKENDMFILSNSTTKFIEPRNLENHFKLAIKACKIDDANFHALRHTFATRCVELGFDVKSLSEILGHASVNITMNRYVHPSMELKQKNMNMLSAFIAVKK